MKRLYRFLFLTKWRIIRYAWPYPEGYGIYRKHRITGRMTVVDRYRTRDEAVEACKHQNKQSINMKPKQQFIAYPSKEGERESLLDHLRKRIKDLKQVIDNSPHHSLVSITAEGQIKEVKSFIRKLKQLQK